MLWKSVSSLSFWSAVSGSNVGLDVFEASLVVSSVLVDSAEPTTAAGSSFDTVSVLLGVESIA